MDASFHRSKGTKIYMAACRTVGNLQNPGWVVTAQFIELHPAKNRAGKYHFAILFEDGEIAWISEDGRCYVDLLTAVRS